MKFAMVHNNFNVLDLEKSLAFYADAFDMKEVRRITAPDGRRVDTEPQSVKYAIDCAEADRLMRKVRRAVGLR